MGPLRHQLDRLQVYCCGGGCRSGAFLSPLDAVVSCLLFSHRVRISLGLSTRYLVMHTCAELQRPILAGNT